MEARLIHEKSRSVNIKKIFLRRAEYKNKSFGLILNMAKRANFIARSVSCPGRSQPEVGPKSGRNHAEIRNAERISLKRRTFDSVIYCLYLNLLFAHLSSVMHFHVGLGNE